MSSTREDTKTLDNAGRIAPRHDSYAELEINDMGDPHNEANMARREVEGHFPRIVERDLPERTFHLRVETVATTSTHSGIRKDKVVKPAGRCFTIRCLGCDRVYPVAVDTLEAALVVVQEWDCPNKNKEGTT
jgi:hypothetical protein